MDKLDRNSFAIGLVVGQSYGSGGHAAGKLAHFEVYPQTTTATWVAPTGYYGIGSVTIHGDEDLVPENIRKGVNLFNGKLIGTYAPKTTTKRITINTNGTTNVDVPSGYDGLTRVTVVTNFSTSAKSEKITTNGNYTINPPSGYSAMSYLSLEVAVPLNVAEHTKTITSNGDYTITPDSGYAGMSKLKLKVNVPQTSVTAHTKTITSNGNYEVSPPAGYAGMSKLNLTVNVPVNYKSQSKTAPRAKTYQQSVTPDSGYLLSSVIIPSEPNLQAQYIAEGVTICGVTGIYKGGERQAKSLTPNANQLYYGFTVSPDSGYTGLSSVQVYGDKNFRQENIAKGKRIFGLDGTYVSPMKPIEIVPSVDDQLVTPDLTEGYYGFSSVFVPGIEKVGDYGAGYEDGQASRDEEVANLNERIEKLQTEVEESYEEGYNKGYETGVGDIENVYTNLDLIKF